jgi:hypothetical protein
MACGGIESDAVSDPWKKSPSRMLNLSQVTSACATVFNLHCQIFHCHDSATTTSASARYCRVRMRAASYLPRHLTVSTFRGPPLMSVRIQFRSLPLFQPGTIVSCFIFLFILFCFANALFRVPRPALPLRFLSLCTFGLFMPCTFLFFFWLLLFSLTRFSSPRLDAVSPRLDAMSTPRDWTPCQRPRLDATSTPLDYTLRRHPSTTCHVDAPGHVALGPCCIDVPGLCTPCPTSYICMWSCDCALACLFTCIRIRL